jgi:hypothetical protein
MKLNNITPGGFKTNSSFPLPKDELEVFKNETNTLAFSYLPQLSGNCPLMVREIEDCRMSAKGKKYKK